MSENGLPPAADMVSEPQEVLVARLNPNEMMTEGEWKQAIVDRTVLEGARHAHIPEPGSVQFHIAFPLRGQRYLAVPRGAVGVAFFFDCEETTVQ